MKDLRGFVRQNVAAPLLDEADQLTRIFVASINTARKRKRDAKINDRKFDN
jgi:hypothetical protein